MKKNLKLYGKVILVPWILILLLLGMLLYSIFVSNPFPRLVSNLNGICIILIIIDALFIVYEIADIKNIK